MDSNYYLYIVALMSCKLEQLHYFTSPEDITL